MKNYNFFLDIDGTLIPEGKKKISDAVITAIKKAKDGGHRFFINTARPYWLVPEDIFPSDVFDGICSGCGTYITYRGKIIYQKFISNSELKALFKEIESYNMQDFSAIIESFETTYYHGIERLEYSLMGYKKLRCADDLGSAVKDIKAQKFSFYRKAEDFPPSLLSKLKNEYNVMQHPTYVEVAQKGFSKAGAIKLVEREMSIPHESTVAIGDSHNDTEMLGYAALSVAMGNAPHDVKSLCSYVTDTSENDGVAKAIELLTTVVPNLY